MLQKQVFLILILLLILCSCYSTGGELGSRNFDAAECEFVLDQLHFGLYTSDGEVSEEKWDQFVNDVIAKQFPNGFTVIDARGQWQGRNGKIIKENTKLVQIVHETESESDNKIKEIIGGYKVKFLQESVLRFTSCQEVKF
ncbi:MAG TPA: DUF3574 domain-containing protein [Thermodesulfobacteriota bacterium]|nr:DUF3574 domain-containing protein [Thermodesulfobacteriota bacterium]